MAKNKIRARDLQGISIQQDEKQTVLYDFIDRKPRRLDDEDARQYTIWQMRAPIAILIGVLLFSKNDNIPISVFVGIGVYIVAYLIYLYTFVKKLPIAKKFEKKVQEPLPVRFSKRLSSIRLIGSTLIAFLLCVLLIVYANMVQYQGFYLYFTYLLSFGALVLSCISGYAFYLKKKNEKKN